MNKNIYWFRLILNRCEAIPFFVGSGHGFSHYGGFEARKIVLLEDPSSGRAATQHWFEFFLNSVLGPNLLNPSPAENWDPDSSCVLKGQCHEKSCSAEALV